MKWKSKGPKFSGYYLGWFGGEDYRVVQYCCHGQFWFGKDTPIKWINCAAYPKPKKAKENKDD